MTVTFDYIQNNQTTDAQITQILLQEFDKYSESEVYGTAATRGVLVRQHGDLKDQPSRLAEAPLVLQFIKNTDRFSNAIGKDPRKADSFPNTGITDFNNIQPATNLGPTIESRVITVQSTGPNTNFFVTTQNMSVTGDGASRYSDLVYISCIWNAIQKSWVSHTGDTAMAQAAFKKSVSENIRATVKQRVVGLTILDVKTTFDGSGTTWFTEVHYGLVGDRKIQNGTIVAHRL